MKKIEKILGKIVEVAIYCLIFIIPFSKAGIEIFGTIAIIAWSIKALLMRSNPFASLPKHVVFTLLLLFLANIASCVVSVSLAHSLKALFAKTLEYMLFFLIVAEVFSDAKRSKKLLWIISISLALFFIDGIVQYVTGFDLVRKYRLDGYMRGPMGSHNDFGTYVIIFIPIFLAFAINMKQSLKYRIIMFIVLSMSLCCLFLSSCRAAWVGFIFMMVFFVIVKNKWLFLSSVLVLILSLFLLQDFVKSNIKEEDVKERISADYSINHRFLMAKEAIIMILDRPVLGMGLNTYTIMGPKYKIHPLGGMYPHNSYLHKTVETGLVGLGMFFLFVWSLYSIGIRSLWLLSSKNMTGSIEYVLIRGLMAGLIGLLVNALFDTTFYALKLITVFWVMSGMLIAACNIVSQKLKSDFKTISK